MAAGEPERRLRIALLGSSPRVLAAWRNGLRVHGVEVAGESRLCGFDATLADAADGVLVVLHGVDDEDLDALEWVTERFGGPIVFCDEPGVDAELLARLASKLEAAVPPAERGGHAAAVPVRERTAVRFPVWVLGASFGGPDMLRRFLGSLPAEPPVAFIVAQHVGEGFAEVLAQQLNRRCAQPVVCATEGMPLLAGHAYVAPVRQRVDIDRGGCFRLGEDYGGECACLPSIDHVMTAVSRSCGALAGAIVFSGMGDDGSAGARAVAAAGGTVWAQDRASCAVDSMPECAAATGTVTRRGAPEALAEELLAHLRPGRPAWGSALGGMQSAPQTH